MAINKNKVQLQETTLDSDGHPLASTDVNPLTSSDCVIMENGMTLEDVMGNDTVATPTIMNEDTSFKAGIGDSEAKVIDGDVAKMVIEGKTYKNILPKPTTLIMNTDEKEFKINDKIDSSIVLDDNVAEIATVKGQTYVNVVQEESASEYVAIGEELNGQSITTTGKPEGYVKNATLEGLTLVNTIQEPSGADATVLELDADIDAQNATIDNTVQGGIHGATLKGQTLVNLCPHYTYSKTTSTNSWAVIGSFTYNLTIGKKYFISVNVSKNTFTDGGQSLYIDGATTSQYGVITFTGKSGYVSSIFTANIDAYRICCELTSHTSQGEIEITDIMLIEYQEGMENWDIPYFEGMESVEVPSVKTTGKNLVNIPDKIVEYSDVPDSGKLGTLPPLIANFKIKPNTSYILKYNFSHPDDFASDRYPAIFLTDSIALRTITHNDLYAFTIYENHGITLGSDTTNTIKFNSNKYSYLHFTLNSAILKEGKSISISNIQLEEGSTATSYEPYQSSTLTTPSDVVLRKVGDVQDELDLETGKLTQRISEIVLDGSSDENWILYEDEYSTKPNTTLFRLDLNGIHIPSSPCICSNFIDKNTYDIDEESVFFASGFRIRLNKTRLATDDIAGLMTWLASNPLTIQYQLAAPIIHQVDLSIVDQDNNTVKSIQTHPTLTHITTSSNGLIPFVSIPSQLKYPTIIKPSTTYTVQLKQTTVNSEFPLTINLGGTVMAVPSTKFTIATPSALTSQDVIFTGKNNVIGEVVITEGDTTGIEYRYFEGMNDVKSPSMYATGKNLFDGKLELGQYWDGACVDNNTTKRNINPVRVKPNTTYKFSTNIGQQDINVMYHDINKNFIYYGGYKSTFTTPSNCHYINFYNLADEHNTGVELSDYQLQIEEGSTATSYEPYKGVTIEQSIDSIPLTSSMFEQNGYDGATNGIKGMSLQQFPAITHSGRIRSKALIKVKPNTKYTFNSSDLLLTALAMDANGGYINVIGFCTTFTTDANTYYIVPILKKSDNSDITPSSLDSLNLTLQEVTQEIVLRSLPNGVKDTLNLTTGEYVQRIKEVVLNGSENWVKATNKPENTAYEYRLDTTDIKLYAGLICNKLKHGGAENQAWLSTENAIYCGGRSKIIYITHVDIDNSNDFKQWLQQNPVTVQYELATPIIKKVNLTNTTKIPSYNSTTHYDTIVPSNSLIPNIKLPSTIDYNVAIKPSTQYTVRCNTTNALSVNLGGSTGTLANGKVVLTTPSTLAHNSLKLGSSGKAKEVMVIEGSEIKDNVPFFNGMKNVQMGGIKLVNLVRNISTYNDFISINANKTTITYTDTGYYGNVNFDSSLLKPNTLYTLYFKIVQNTSTVNEPCGIDIDGNAIYPVVGNGGTGTFKIAFTSLDKLTREPRFVFRHSTNDAIIKIQDLMLFEGDWTHLDEIPFIESEMIIEQLIIRSQGKNLSDGKLESGRYAQNQGVPFPDNTAVRTVNKIKVKPSTVYTLKIEDGTSLYNTSEYCNGIYIGFKTASNSLTFTTSPTTNELHLSFKTDNINLQYQIEESSSETTYEPFKQHTLSSNRVIGYEENCYYAHGGGAKVPTDTINSMLADVEGLSIAYVTGGSSNYTFWDKDNVFISGKQYLDTSLSSYDKNGFIAIPSNAKYMRFAAGGETNSQPLYKTATVTGELPLRSLPNGVCDSFNLVTGEYVQRIGEVVLDGSSDEKWKGYNKPANNTIAFYTDYNFTNNNYANCYLISDKLQRLTKIELVNKDLEGISADDDNARGFIFIRVDKSKLLTQDINGIEQYLSQNPITVQYELATPIVRKIGLTAKGNYKEVELNGDEEWGLVSNQTTTRTLLAQYMISDKNISNAINCIFNNKYFPTTSADRLWSNDIQGLAHNTLGHMQIRVNRSELKNQNIDGFKQWLSQNPMRVGYPTNNSASSYSNIQKPIFFNNVKVQFMNDNVDIQPTLTLQSRSRNSYVMDMMKANTVYTLKALINSGSFTIDGTSYGVGTNGTFTSPSTLTNKLMITGQDVQELMIIEGDVTGKQLPYYKGIRSSFDNTDKVEVFVRNKNLVKELYPMLNDNTCVIENGVITIKGNGDGSGELNCVFNPSIYLEKDKTYTFSFSSDAQFGKTNGTDTVEAFLLKDGGTGYYIETYGFTRVFTCGNTGYYNIRLDINKNNTTHKFYNIQIEESPTATPYQPHKENTTIVNMPTQLETVEVVRPIIEVGRIATTDGQNDDNDTGSRRSKDYIPVEPNMNLTFMNGNTYRAENVYLYGINKNYISAKYTDGSGDLTIPKDCYFIRFYSGTANTSDITVIKKQYKPIALNSLPNGVKDELIINRATSSAKLIRRVGKVVLDGSEDWKGLTEHNNNFRVSLQISNMKYEDGGGNSSTIYAINDKLPTMEWHGSWNTTCDAISCNTKNIHIHLINKHYATINLFKEYLKQNPITVYYELAEPVITEIRLKGYPFVYEDGSITLNTDIAPVTRTSYNVNQHQLINSQNETIIRHDKQISDLYDYIEIYLDEIYRMELFKMQLELSL